MTGSWLEDLVARIEDGAGYVGPRLHWSDALVLDRAAKILARCAEQEKAEEIEELVSFECDGDPDGVLRGPDRAGRLFLFDPWAMDDVMEAPAGMVFDDAS